MATRTNFSGYPISSGYVQQLITENTDLSTITGADTTTVVYAANNTASALEVGTASVAISDGSVNFNVKSHDGTNGLKLGSVLVTASAAELNYLDTTTGVALASKAMVADGSANMLFRDTGGSDYKLKFGTGSDMTLYHDGSHSYITNATGILKLATETSGIAVTIGHTTSETTVADNLNTTGLIRVNDTTEATSATDGSLQTDGGLSVVKDCVFGDDVFLLSDSAVLNMGAGNDFTITHDGTTGATLAGNPITITSGGTSTWSTSSGALTVDSAASTLTLDGHTGVTVQSSNSGDITLDSVADVVLDAAGGNFEFKDAGVTQLTIDVDSTAGDIDVNLNVDGDDLVFNQYDGTEVMRLTDDVKVGIGVAVPEAKLHIFTGEASIAPVGSADELVIEGSGHTGMSILGGASHSLTIAFGDSGDADIGQISYDHGSNAMNFVVAASQAMIIDSSQQVGIGTTSPDTLLEVSGSFAANGPSSTFVTMASGDTSPDVSGGNIFKSHTDGVTIDQFDGGICGQIITIISGGATVYDVTSSELNGGTTNITTAAGDVTMWVCESATDWHLLSWMDLSIDLSSGGF